MEKQLSFINHLNPHLPTQCFKLFIHLVFINQSDHPYTLLTSTNPIMHTARLHQPIRSCIQPVYSNLSDHAYTLFTSTNLIIFYLSIKPTVFLRRERSQPWGGSSVSSANRNWRWQGCISDRSVHCWHRRHDRSPPPTKLRQVGDRQVRGWEVTDR